MNAYDYKTLCKVRERLSDLDDAYGSLADVMRAMDAREQKLRALAQRLAMLLREHCPKHSILAECQAAGLLPKTANKETTP